MASTSQPPPPQELEGKLPLEQQLVMNSRRRDAFVQWKADDLVDELRAHATWSRRW